MHKNKTVLLISGIGILLCSVVTLTSAPKEYLKDLLVGTIVSWIPYILTFVASTLTKSSRLRQSLSGGLLLYLIIDLLVRYAALHRPSSSTDAIAVVIVLIASVVIIPAGAGLTYLMLALRK